MIDLVVVQNGRLIVSSKAVSDKFKKVHKHLLRDIEKLQCSDEFRESNFALSSYTSKQNKILPCYDITRDGFAFLCMGFTGKKAATWKEKYIEAFNQMEKALIQQAKNGEDSEWLRISSQSKELRLQQTDVIKEFVEYATSQGSKSAKFYYKHYTNATYKALGLIQHKKPKLKDTLDCMELSQLMVAENVAKKSIRKHMENGEHYKTVFTLVKQDLLLLSETLMIN
jgi:Rha family phage regulatory protein